MSRNLYQKLKTHDFINPKSEKYLWVRDMEWIDPKQSKKYKGKIPKNVMPIAATGAGDIWGIFGIEVFLYFHDDDEVLFYADNLKNAIFRAIVEYLSDNDFISENELDENNAVFAVSYVKNCIDIFSDDFSEEQINDLKQISEQSISEFYYSSGTPYHSFISVDDADKIIRKYIPINDENNSDEICDNSETAEDITLSDCFSSDELDRLRHYCKEKGTYYKDKATEFSQTIPNNTNLQELWYKGGRYEPFLYRLDDIFIDNSFDIGTKKKSGSDVKGNLTIYYTDDSGSPVYSKTFLDGPSNPYSFVRYYFKPDDNTVLFHEYIWFEDKSEFKYSRTVENCYNSDGKLISYLWYDDSGITVADYYDYTDNKLSLCRNLNYFDLDKDIGVVEDNLSLDGYRNNPLNFSKSIYEYSNDIITSVHKTKCNDEGCKHYVFDVTEKIYKAVLKKKLI
ncbi:MAG: hypothetical protein IJ368_04290 [Oscillospiraceae bacterium]|nr:hypothetical protein [Oscillospiraceae bacterium]